MLPSVANLIVVEIIHMHMSWAIKLSETRGTEGHMRATRTACIRYFIFSRRNYEVIRYSNIRRGERGAWNGYTSCSPKQRDILVYQSLYNATYGVNALTSIRLYRELTSVRFPRHFRQKATSVKRYITRLNTAVGHIQSI